MLELKHHNSMFYNGHKFRIKKLDEKKKTYDCGINKVLQVTNVSSRSGKHPGVSDNRYYGYFNYILECDFESSKIVLFDVKWYRLRMNECDYNIMVIEHNRIFTMVNTRSFKPRIDHYVLASECKHVFYSEV